jgi:hypothetical protein
VAEGLSAFQLCQYMRVPSKDSKYPDVSSDASDNAGRLRSSVVIKNTTGRFMHIEYDMAIK